MRFLGRKKASRPIKHGQLELPKDEKEQFLNSLPGRCSMEGVCRRAEGGRASLAKLGGGTAGSEGEGQRES